MCVPSSSIIETGCLFSKYCFRVACSRLFCCSLWLQLSVSRLAYQCRPSSLTELLNRSGNIQCCPLVCHSSSFANVSLSELFSTCWQIVWFLTFVSADCWNSRFINRFRSCITPELGMPSVILFYFYLPCKYWRYYSSKAKKLQRNMTVVIRNDKLLHYLHIIMLNHFQ